ncbi:MAG: type II secretion system F family protein [Rickettsiales bacterium]
MIALVSAKKIADSRELRRRIDRMRMKSSAAPKVMRELSLRRKNLESKGLSSILLKPLPNSKRIAILLDNAGIKITPKQFILRRFVTVLLIIAGAAIFKFSVLMSIPVALIAGIWLPFKIIKMKMEKRSREFLRAFPEAIDLIVRGLRSGLPVSDSIVQVSTELPDPIGSVFATVANKMKLGISLEKSLLETAKELNLREFHFFTTSIILQRETGGNLSEILNNLSDVLRSRFMMKMKIKAITSEARASAVIIGSLPFVVAAAVMFVSPNYLKPLIEEEGGNQALAVAFGMLSFGIWSMNRMSRFEI